jgi:hypothetical protein
MEPGLVVMVPGLEAMVPGQEAMVPGQEAMVPGLDHSPIKGSIYIVQKNSRRCPGPANGLSLMGKLDNRNRLPQMVS